jgi:hypothetical protein
MFVAIAAAAAILMQTANNTASIVALGQASAMQMPTMKSLVPHCCFFVVPRRRSA